MLSIIAIRTPASVPNSATDSLYDLGQILSPPCLSLTHWCQTYRPLARSSLWSYMIWPIGLWANSMCCIGNMLAPVLAPALHRAGPTGHHVQPVPWTPCGKWGQHMLHWAWGQDLAHTAQKVGPDLVCRLGL